MAAMKPNGKQRQMNQFHTPPLCARLISTVLSDPAITTPASSDRPTGIS